MLTAKKNSKRGKMKEEIKKFVDEYINPALKNHDGFLEITDFDADNNDIYVKMGGGCQGCAASGATLHVQIENFLREEFPKLGKVIDVTDHEAGTNPHFSRE